MKITNEKQGNNLKKFSRIMLVFTIGLTYTCGIFWGPSLKGHVEDTLMIIFVPAFISYYSLWKSETWDIDGDEQ